jgi:hypothetical protein
VKGAPEVMGEICDRDSCVYLSHMEVNCTDFRYGNQFLVTMMTSFLITPSADIV